jgi:hypothetical protein
MKALLPAISLAFGFVLFGCSAERVQTPAIPLCGSAHVSRGTAVSKEIAAPAFVVAMRSFAAQRPLKWHRVSSWASSPAGDVAIALFDGSERKALIQFSPSFLMVDDFYAELEPEEVDTLLAIVGLTRYDAFTRDFEKRQPNKAPLLPTTDPATSPAGAGVASTPVAADR